MIFALLQAINKRNPLPGLIFHSDRGSQYASDAFKESLRKIGAQQSMSKKGDCYYNGVAESFFASLKKELVYHEFFPTREIAKTKIFEYIELYFNQTRIHTFLQNLTPNEFEKIKNAA